MDHAAHISLSHSSAMAPSYRKGDFLLQWRPCRSDWIVVEVSVNGKQFVWANVVKDSGSPANAKIPWYGWNGKEYVIDHGISCEVAGPSPCSHPPHACKCCGGISLHAAALQSFMGRVAAVLEERRPKSFALLHSGHYMGFRDEVEKFQSELEWGVEYFNAGSGCIHGRVLRKPEATHDNMPYWKRVDGVLLFPRLES